MVSMVAWAQMLPPVMPLSQQTALATMGTTSLQILTQALVHTTSMTTPWYHHQEPSGKLACDQQQHCLHVAFLTSVATPSVRAST